MMSFLSHSAFGTDKAFGVTEEELLMNREKMMSVPWTYKQTPGCCVNFVGADFAEPLNKIFFVFVLRKVQDLIFFWHVLCKSSYLKQETTKEVKSC